MHRFCTIEFSKLLHGFLQLIEQLYYRQKFPSCLLQGTEYRWYMVEYPSYITSWISVSSEYSSPHLILKNLPKVPSFESIVLVVFFIVDETDVSYSIEGLDYIQYYLYRYSIYLIKGRWVFSETKLTSWEEVRSIICFIFLATIFLIVSIK